MGRRLAVQASSPHTRGLRPHAGPARRSVRIIPAHAGFTPSRDRCHVTATDHPRTRGVYWPPSHTHTAGRGSSPHTRGLRPTAPSPAGAQRIIPAHAGFTCRNRLVPPLHRDHPRTRGVYGDLALTGEHVAGSSPHTRGLLLLPSVSLVLCWIIPAHAGFTACPLGAAWPAGDHPRTRGVYSLRPARRSTPAGSSPHTRGLRVGAPHGGCDGGIIPAHAGFTCASLSGAPLVSDHPRTRGVYHSTTSPRPWPPGSSPHTRGLHLMILSVCPPARIIPAHAGFTPPPPRR